MILDRINAEEKRRRRSRTGKFFFNMEHPIIDVDRRKFGFAIFFIALTGTIILWNSKCVDDFPLPNVLSYAGCCLLTNFSMCYIICTCTWALGYCLQTFRYTRMNHAQWSESFNVNRWNWLEELIRFHVE